MNRKLERELTRLANSPLDIRDIELLELTAVEVLMEGKSPDLVSVSAKHILRVAAEIRKARGCFDDDTAMSQDEIDTEIAVIRGAS